MIYTPADREGEYTARRTPSGTRAKSKPPPAPPQTLEEMLATPPPGIEEITKLRIKAEKRRHKLEAARRGENARAEALRPAFEEQEQRLRRATDKEA